MKNTTLLENHENFALNQLKINPAYTYEILTKKYLEEVATEFTNTFCRSEPMTHYLKMDETKYKEFAYAVTEKAIQDECSIVALDKGKVIAFALVEDLTDPGSIPDFDPKFIFILTLLEKLGNHFFQGKEFSKNHIAHLFITAVDEAYRHQGLSTQVNFQAMDLAAKKGFDFMYCEFTNHFNEKGTIPHLKNNKKLIGSESYKNFTLDKIKPFPQLEGGANSYLWAIRNNAELIYKHNNQLITTSI